MKAYRICTLLALLMLGGVKLQAQEQLNLFSCRKALNFAPMMSPTIVSVEDEWLHYGTEVYGNNLGYVPVGIPFSWAVSFTPEILKPYDGFTMTKVALYENEWNTGNLMLQVCYGDAFKPLIVMDEQIVVPENLVGFAEIALQHPVEIDALQHLWIVFSELEVTETFSAAFSENTVNPNPNARWVQLEEDEWADAATYGAWERVQFMIWGYVTNDPWSIEVLLVPTATSVYPNPGKDVLNIRTGLQDARVEIYDLSGRLVHSQSLEGDVTEIDAMAWPSGTYIWKVMANDKEVETGKWIKE